MEGVLDPLMRQILTQNKSLDYCTTEFIRVTERLLPSHVFYRYAPELRTDSKTRSMTPVLIQILGGKPEWMGLNAKKAKELGAFGVDINFGCPAKTVNKHDGGATLLKSPKRLFKTISKVKESVGKNFHVSAKVRLGFSDKSLVKEIAQACSEAQASWMTVHARTKQEAYKPPAHWSFIRLMKEHCKIPIFANGDIWSLKDYKNCVSESGCDDVMIGRGLLRNPFLAEEIKYNQELDPKLKETETLNMIINYSQTGPQVYGKLKALNRVKQWLRMCSYPNYKYFEDIFLFAKRAKTMEDLQLILEDKRSFLG